jgi:hypothetical protein
MNLSLQIKKAINHSKLMHHSMIVDSISMEFLTLARIEMGRKYSSSDIIPKFSFNFLFNYLIIQNSPKNSFWKEKGESVEWINESTCKKDV